MSYDAQLSSRSVMLTHVVVVDGITVAVVLMVQYLPRLLVDQLVEEHGEERGAERDNRIQVNRVPR